MVLLAAVCVNKHDINDENTETMKRFCMERKIPVVGMLPYDEVATDAMLVERTVLEHSEGELSKAIRGMWLELEKRLS